MKTISVSSSPSCSPFRLLSCACSLGLCLLLFSLIATVAGAQAPVIQPQYKAKLFNRQEVMIPVRDEVHLQTVIFTPRRSTGPLPFLMVRTPYGVPEDESGLTSGTSDDLIDDGYIFVFQNIRGRFKSEGQFVMQRPARDRAPAG